MATRYSQVKFATLELIWFGIGVEQSFNRSEAGDGLHEQPRSELRYTMMMFLSACFFVFYVGEYGLSSFNSII